MDRNRQNWLKSQCDDIRLIPGDDCDAVRNVDHFVRKYDRKNGGRSRNNQNGANGESKKVIVLGGDGFCGWPTSLYLSDQGHDVVIVDNLSRRKIDLDLGCDSLTPIASMEVSHFGESTIDVTAILKCVG